MNGAWPETTNIATGTRSSGALVGVVFCWPTAMVDQLFAGHGRRRVGQSVDVCLAKQMV